MKKLLLFSALLIFACSSDDEGNPCVYEPTLTTEAVTDITETSAILNGVISIVSENCDAPNNTEQGFVYSTEIQPTLEDTQVNVNGTSISTTIDDLQSNTAYYVRTFVTNALGEFYGNEIDFTTEEVLTETCNEPGTVIGQDGNSYDYLCYGNKAWTVENAVMVSYRDGTPIPEVNGNSNEWATLLTGAWCYYDNDPTKPRLYNWYAVAGIHDEASYYDASLRKEFAPEGWHVASDAEWTTLEEHLIANGYNYDGTITGNKIAKAMASTTGWVSSTDTGVVGNDPNLNNSSGFNAYPEGYEYSPFSGLSESAIFWTSTRDGNQVPKARSLYYNGDSLYFTTCLPTCGFSVRFVRDWP